MTLVKSVMSVWVDSFDSDSDSFVCLIERAELPWMSDMLLMNQNSDSVN